MPTKDEIIDIILNSDSEHDWKYANEEVRYYKSDVNLRFENMGIEKEDFREEWTKKIYDEKVSSYRFLLYYASTPIQEFLLVSVDGAYIMLPIPPVPQKLEVERLKFKVAEIHNHHDIRSFHECIKMAGITVKDD